MVFYLKCKGYIIVVQDLQKWKSFHRNFT